MSNLQDLPSNWLKVPNSIMAPRYKRGEWIGFEEAAAPKADRDFIFTGPDGRTVMLARLAGWNDTHWRIVQYDGHDGAERKLWLRRRLSRKKWQCRWLVRFTFLACRANEADPFVQQLERMAASGTSEAVAS